MPNRIMAITSPTNGLWLANRRTQGLRADSCFPLLPVSLAAASSRLRLGTGCFDGRRCIARELIPRVGGPNEAFSCVILLLLLSLGREGRPKGVRDARNAMQGQQTATRLHGTRTSSPETGPRPRSRVGAAAPREKNIKLVCTWLWCPSFLALYPWNLILYTLHTPLHPINMI
jgi:hypothetical protein